MVAPVCRNLKVIAPIVGGIICAVRIVADALEIVIDVVIIIAFQLVLKIFELTVDAEIVITVFVAEPFEAAEASAVPHAKAAAEQAV